MDLRRTASGALILNDAYNANPISMAAALRSLAALDAERRVAVLGTMAELGEVAEAEHLAVATLAADLGVRLIALAEPRYGVEQVPDVAAAAEALGSLTDGDAVLLKGSRVAGLERLADLLLP
jgi:UDP-N-acetylmuramoyl-tripeptide--D-alanyl-D-alanine ligase